jgi:hypothetical protein
MDADRRIKTVIAGTFAIDRKSLSNAQPISPVGLRCTPVISMTLPSMNARAISRRRDAGAEGFHPRDAAGSFTLVERKTDPRPTASDRAPGRPRIWKARSGDPAGKISTSNRLLAFAPRSRSFFLFQNPARNVLRFENV